MNPCLSMFKEQEILIENSRARALVKPSNPDDLNIDEGIFDHVYLSGLSKTGEPPRRVVFQASAEVAHALQWLRAAGESISEYINAAIAEYDDLSNPRWRFSRQLVESIDKAAAWKGLTSEQFTAYVLSEAAERVNSAALPRDNAAKPDRYYESVAEFVSLQCVQTLTSGEGSYASRLFSVFAEYQRQRSEEPGNPQRFGMALAGLNLLKSRTTDGFMYNLIVKRELIEALGIE